MINYRGKKKKSYQAGGRKVDIVPEGYNPLREEGNRKYYNKILTIPEAQGTVNTGGGAAYDQFLQQQLGSGITPEQLVERKYISRDRINDYRKYYKPSEDIVYTETDQVSTPTISSDQLANFNEFYRGANNYNLYRPSRRGQNLEPGTLDIFGEPIGKDGYVYVTSTGSRDSAIPDMSRGVRRIPADIWENQFSGGSTELKDETALRQYFEQTPAWTPQSMGKVSVKKKGGLYAQRGMLMYEQMENERQKMIQDNVMQNLRGLKPTVDFDNRPVPDVTTSRPEMNRLQQGINKGIIQKPRGYASAQEWYDHNSQPEEAEQKSDWMTPLGIGIMGSRAVLSEISGRIERRRQDNYDMAQRRMFNDIDPMNAELLQPNPYSIYAKYGGKLKNYETGGKFIDPYPYFNNDVEMKMDAQFGGLMSMDNVRKIKYDRFGNPRKIKFHRGAAPVTQQFFPMKPNIPGTNYFYNPQVMGMNPFPTIMQKGGLNKNTYRGRK